MRMENCVLACINASGEPDFTFVRIHCEEEQHEQGHHYDYAQNWALENGYEAPFVIWDSTECPDWLSERFVWESASIITI